MRKVVAGLLGAAMVTSVGVTMPTVAQAAPPDTATKAGETARVDDHPNRLEPGKRTFHTLIPAMLAKDGRPWLAYGTMGGEGQPQTQTAVLTRIVDFGFDLQSAIEAPRWLLGRTWGAASSALHLEERIPGRVIEDLRGMGHPVAFTPAWDEQLGHAQAVAIDSQRGLLLGGADPRGDGTAVGY